MARSTISRLERGSLTAKPALWMNLTDALAVSRLDAVNGWMDGEPRGASLLGFCDYLVTQGDGDAATLVLTRAEHVNRLVYNGRYDGDLYRLRGRLAYLVGDFDGACRQFEAMERHARAHANTSARARAAYDYGVALARCGRLEAALAALQTATEAATEAGETLMLGYVHWAAGNLLLDRESYAEARTHYESAIGNLQGDERVGYPRWGVLVCRWELGEPHLLEAVTSFAAEAPAPLRARVLYVVGTMHREAGDLATALQWLGQALSAAEPGGGDWAATQAERLLCLYRDGQTAAAQAVVRDLTQCGPPRFDSYQEALPAAWVTARLAPDAVGALLPPPHSSAQRRLDTLIRTNMERFPPFRGEPTHL